MPDLLAHALLAYSLCTLLAWRYSWVTPALITVGMAGAFIPDLAKAALVVPSSTIEQTLGIPFEWFALHTGGGVLVSVAIGGLLVAPRFRRPVIGMLAIGATSHLLADALLLTPDGRSYAILWPLTRYHPPTPGLYLSTRPEPTIVALVTAILVAVVTRYLKPR